MFRNPSTELSVVVFEVMIKSTPSGSSVTFVGQRGGRSILSAKKQEEKLKGILTIASISDVQKEKRLGNSPV